MKLTKEQKMMLGVVALAGVAVVLYDRKQKRERAAQGFSNAVGSADKVRSNPCMDAYGQLHADCCRKNPDLCGGSVKRKFDPNRGYNSPRGNYSNVGGKHYSVTCAKGTNQEGQTFWTTGNIIHLEHNGDVEGWKKWACDRIIIGDVGAANPYGGSGGKVGRAEMLNAAILRPKFGRTKAVPTGGQDPCANLSGNSLKDCCRIQGNASLKCRSISVSKRRVVRPRFSNAIGSASADPCGGYQDDMEGCCKAFPHSYTCRKMHGGVAKVVNRPVRPRAGGRTLMK